MPKFASFDEALDFMQSEFRRLLESPHFVELNTFGGLNGVMLAASIPSPHRLCLAYKVRRDGAVSATARDERDAVLVFRWESGSGLTKYSEFNTVEEALADLPSIPSATPAEYLSVREYLASQRPDPTPR